MGLDIIAAGKASEYDFVWDPDTGEFTYMEGEEKPHENIPGIRDCWHYEGRETLAAREKLLENYMAVISADLCEMNLVSNVTGCSHLRRASAIRSQRSASWPISLSRRKTAGS